MPVNSFPMTSAQQQIEFGPAAQVTTPMPAPSILIICEHASNHVPVNLKGLGLSADELSKHIAWDPGAAAVAKALVNRLPAVLVEGTLSRLVYDCNRPPSALSAIPTKSEIYEIPGNQGLTQAETAARVAQVYQPFCNIVAQQVAKYRATLSSLVTIHSFTPVFNGQRRDVEIGVLHGADEQLAKMMMAHKPQDLPYVTRLNEPYSAQDGVAHTLDLHGTENNLPNVMIEIRNDLIETPTQQVAMADQLASWIEVTLAAGLTREGQA